MSMDVTLKVIGAPATGKTTIALLLSEFLSEQGFEVQYSDPDTPAHMLPAQYERLQKFKKQKLLIRIEHVMADRHGKSLGEPSIDIKELDVKDNGVLVLRGTYPIQFLATIRKKFSELGKKVTCINLQEENQTLEALDDEQMENAGWIRKPLKGIRVRHKKKDFGGVTGKFNVSAISEIIVNFDDGSMDTDFIKNYDVFIKALQEWKDLGEAFKDKDLIPDNANRYFLEPTTPEDRERGYIL